jgi:SAM-dependent methyltransferase
MDDRTFDEPTARKWIQIIESGPNQLREQDIYPRLRAWVERVSPARILEIGCGQGACSGRIPLNGRSYVGTDPSPFLIKRAKELQEAPEREFVTGNAYRLPFVDRQFDAAFSVMVWHLLRDIHEASLEMSRVLKPGGRCLVISANPEAYAEWMELYVNKRCEGKRFEGDMELEGKVVDHDVLYLHTRDEILAALKTAQFEVAGVESFRRPRQGRGPGYLIAIEGTLSRPLCITRR